MGDRGSVSRTYFDYFTYHMGYKVIFASRESHLLIKGAKNRKAFIMDPNSHM